MKSERKHISKWSKINVVNDGTLALSFELDEHGCLKKKLRRQLPRDLTAEIKKIPKKDLTIDNSPIVSPPILNNNSLIVPILNSDTNLQTSNLIIPNYNQTVEQTVDQSSKLQTDPDSIISSDQNEFFDIDDQSFIPGAISSDDFGVDYFNVTPFETDETNIFDFQF